MQTSNPRFNVRGYMAVSDDYMVETLYAICDDGRVFTRTEKRVFPGKPLAYFTHKHAKWTRTTDSRQTIEGLEFIGYYMVPEIS